MDLPSKVSCEMISVILYSHRPVSYYLFLIYICPGDEIDFCYPWRSFNSNFNNFLQTHHLHFWRYTIKFDFTILNLASVFRVICSLAQLVNISLNSFS